jgi:hypothetical protein
MATGDILSATVDTTGYKLSIVIAGFSTGASYTDGYTGSHVPGAGTPYSSIVSKGYTGNVLGTRNRTAYFSRILRKVFPSQLVLDETAGGGNLTVVIALAEPIFASDTSATVTIPAQWARNAGGGGEYTASATALSVTNNSTLAYPKCIGHFALPDRVCVNGLVDIEAFVVQAFGQQNCPIAYIEFTATGGTSGTVKTGNASSMTLSNRGDLLPVYKPTAQLDLSISAGFTRGEVININFKAYPWIGDATAILDSNADAGTEVFQLKNLQWCCMETMICVVDPVGGNDGTAVASRTQATADANPAQTTNGAVTAIQTANNGLGVNRADGGQVQWKAGTYVWNKTGSQTVTNGRITFTRHSSATRAQVILDGNGGTKTQYNHQCFYDITFARTASAYTIFTAGTGNTLCMDAVSCTDSFDSGWYSGETSTPRSTVDFIDCVSTTCRLVARGNDTHGRLIRNYTITPSVDTTITCGSHMCLLGVKATGGSVGTWTSLASSGFNNIISAYCSVKSITDGLVWSNQITDALTNFAIISCLVERIGASNTPIAEISAAANANMVIVGNTFAGQRVNIENSIVNGATNFTVKNFYWRHNYYSARGDHRSDIFASDANLVGAWWVYNSVGIRDNHMAGYAYAGDADFYGLYSNFVAGSNVISPPTVVPGFVNDKSRDVSGVGGGDYTPDTGSILKNRIRAGDAFCAYDINGVAVRNDGTGDIGAIQSAAATGFNYAGMRGGLRLLKTFDTAKRKGRRLTLAPVTRR